MMVASKLKRGNSFSSLRSLRLCVRLCLLGALLPLLVIGGNLHAQRDARIPDPDPEIERQSLQVAEGFEVNLFAADPLLAKPIQMNFDARGRLWVACSEVYPQIKPGQKANDKIIILEDTKGVGRADKTTVFADSLLIPTGVEPGDGGAYVANSTELVHLAAADGDGKADRRHVILSGFGTEDTHHLLHTLRWGPEGMLYFNQSIYIHSHIETPHGVRRLGGGGIWQFRPETARLEVFARGFVNPWGHHFDRWGQSFVTDGAFGEGINYLLPGASYTNAPGATRVLAGLNPGSPKHCGAEIVSGRHLPPDWQGNILTNDFRGNRVCRFVLKEDGAGFASQEMAELIKTTHPAFRPIDIKMGPDGAIYIADWYNPIIQHGEVDFRDPRRDLTHGRVWRVSARGRPLVPHPQLADAPTTALLEALKAPEDWTRHFAKRVLKERGPKVLPELSAWVQRLHAADPEHDHHLLEALWTYQSLDVVEPKLLNSLLQAKDHRARAAATRVLQQWHPRLPDALALLTARVADEHPRVRLEAVRVLGQIPSAEAARIALRALDKPVDRYLDYALWLTMRELQTSWLPELQKGEKRFGGNVNQQIFALQALDSAAAVGPLVELIQKGRVPKEREESVLATIATLGDPAELKLILDQLLSNETNLPERQAILLTALAQAARQRSAYPAGDLNRVGKLLAADSDPVRVAVARLVGLWQVEALRPQLLEHARSERSSAALRRAAIDGLAALGGRPSREVLEQLAGVDRPPEVRAMAVTALVPLDVLAAGRLAVEVLSADSSNAEANDLFAAFLQRKNGAAALTRALAGKKLPADVAKIGIRLARSANAQGLADTLLQAGGIAAVNRTLTPQQMEQMVADVLKLGDPVRGEAVYRRKDMACLKCHAIAGAGGLVGPDLVSIGASAPVDYLIESLLLPNKAIKENYHSLVIGTKDGKSMNGIKVRETETELILRDAEDREVAIPLAMIEERMDGGSLMPEGLTDTLTAGELLDLVRFLSELGKVGPFTVSKARLVRRWQVLEPTSDVRQLLHRTSLAAAAGNDPALVWSPHYSTVAGVLSLEAVPRLDVRNFMGKDTRVLGFVRCQLDASSPGQVKLLLNSTTGLTLWLDGVPVAGKEATVLDLKTGPHTLTFAIVLDQRRDGLRCELDDVPGSAARVQIVGGK